MQLHPAIIIHGLADARDALASGGKLTLLSAPGAALYAGAPWWRALVTAAGFDGIALLDCADAPGRALEALQCGINGIVLNCDGGRFAVVAEIAALQGAILLRTPPPAFDMATRNARRKLQAWLDDKP